MNEFSIIKTLNQSRKPKDFGRKGEDKEGRKQLKQGSKNIFFFSAFINLLTNMS